MEKIKIGAIALAATVINLGIQSIQPLQFM